MGINGLLPLLKSIHKTCHLKKFEGQTLGVDAYGWLHRGAVACAIELATGKSTRKFVDFAMSRVRMLQHFGVLPFLVFDGDYLPSKAATEASRAKRREESKIIGNKLLKAGKVSEAQNEFQKSLDITPEMARQLIDELRATGVQYVVAPYEADSQMVYLETKGLISGIISEDSDLLVFGAKCLLTKLDQYGNCIEVNKSDFSACRDLNLSGWSDTTFRQMAILSGCDYLARMNNMGLKTANRMLRKHKSIENVVRMLQFDAKFCVPLGYLESFHKAELTFLYQRVYCPRKKALVLHTEPPKSLDIENMPFIGAFVEPIIAQGVAKGDLHPMTKLPIVVARDNISPSLTRICQNSHSNQQSTKISRGLPITKYFDKRTPLAELDPNSFTPSPRQQQTLETNPRLWMSSPINQPHLHRNSVRRTRLSLPSGKNSEACQIETALIPSEFRSPKRVRLCSGIDQESDSEPLALHSSPFFSSQSAETSSAEGIREEKKNKILNTKIYSDNSIEDFMLCSMNLDDSLKIRNVTQLNSNPVKNHDHIVDFLKEKPNQKSSVALLDPQSNKTGPPPKKSKDKPKLYPTTKRVLQSTTSIESSLKSGSAQRTFSQIIKEFQLPSKLSVQKQSKIPLASQSSTSGSKVRRISCHLTPLQRISSSATNRSRNLNTPSSSSPHLSSVQVSHVPSLDHSKPLIPNLDKADTTCLPSKDDMRNLLSSTSIGSEDLIVYDSDEES
ncbi:Exonuclease 1 [Golovinomyces cichoracearum]|uniref:Exonuclease 1 n=1 Tax=Golovinomyces cichoracearum TaxID=62708 RepID=A0A420HET3_9PEZI|nr:Exonuclease 1 [Golovinomyces cichoracearum]